MCTRKNIPIMYSIKLLHFGESKYVMNIVMKFLSSSKYMYKEIVCVFNQV